MTVIICEFCDLLTCTRCEDATDHLAGPQHCADPGCVARCVDCQRGYAEDQQEVPC